MTALPRIRIGFFHFKYQKCVLKKFIRSPISISSKKFLITNCFRMAKKCWQSTASAGLKETKWLCRAKCQSRPINLGWQKAAFVLGLFSLSLLWNTTLSEKNKRIKNLFLSQIQGHLDDQSVCVCVCVCACVSTCCRHWPKSFLLHIFLTNFVTWMWVYQRTYHFFLLIFCTCLTPGTLVICFHHRKKKKVEKEGERRRRRRALCLPKTGSDCTQPIQTNVHSLSLCDFEGLAFLLCLKFYINSSST